MFKNHEKILLLKPLMEQREQQEKQSRCFGCFSFEATREEVDLLCNSWEVDASFSHRDRACKEGIEAPLLYLQSQT